MSYGGLRGGVGFSLVNMIPIAVGKLCTMYIKYSVHTIQIGRWHNRLKINIGTVLHSSSCAECYSLKYA
jgi:hypothetical protein